MRIKPLRNRLLALVGANDRSDSTIERVLRRSATRARSAADKLRKAGVGEAEARTTTEFVAAVAAVAAAHATISKTVDATRTAAAREGAGAVQVPDGPDTGRAIRRALAVDGPLRARLDELAGDHAEEVADILIQAASRRDNYTRTASRIRAITDQTTWEARRIARTEQYRAYRTASLAYWRTLDEVTGWVWVARLDGGCGACWAKHGTVYPLDVEMVTHPNCRCTCEPVTSRSRGRVSGEERYRGLTEAQKKNILGPAAAAAYAAGEFEFSDLIQETTDPVWGGSMSTTPLYRLVPDPERRKTYLLARR